MSIRGLARTPRRIRRLAGIIQVLARHGFGHLVQTLDLQRHLPVPLRVLTRGVRGRAADVGELSPARRLVLVLEELGPTFVKLGQLLSTRPDLLPDEYIRELTRLQDQVAPFPSAAARRRIETALGSPLSDLFAEFSDEPLASGSIAQAHMARLKTGEEVVVKVKRPGIEREIHADLDLLRLAAEAAERVEELQFFRPKMLVEEFARTLERELDFVTEASYTAKFGRMFAEWEDVRVPGVIWTHTTTSVLTLEKIKGVGIGRREELERMGIDFLKLGRTLADVFMHQYFAEGLFHADPHPGNLLIDEKGTIGILDFGMVGHIDEDMRGLLGTGLIALVRGELDIVVDVFAEMGALPEDVDHQALKSDLVEILDKYYGIPIGLIDLQKAFADVMRVARENRVIFPRDAVLLGKSFVMISALARQLDPDFDAASAARPHALKLLREKFSPLRVGRSLFDTAWHFSSLLRRLPRDMRAFSRKVLAGKLQIVFRIPELEGLPVELDKATNRLVFGLIVSAVVVGSSLLIHGKIPPLFQDLPLVGEYLQRVVPDLSVLGTIGYVMAFMMGMVLAWSIWRSGKL